MPCHRCGARQTDPVRGASPWRRGVRASEQVLICPDCQRGRDWTADLSHCASCGSARLVRVLGHTECKDCGAEDAVVAESVESGASIESAASASVAEPAVAVGQSSEQAAGSSTPSAPRSDATTLAEDVSAALERQFGRRPDRAP